MKSLAALLTTYLKARGDGRRTRLLEEIARFAPDAAAVDLLIQVARDDSDANEVPRLAALELLGRSRILAGDESLRDRVIDCLTAVLSAGGSVQDRTNALDALASFLPVPRVRSTIHALLLNQGEDQRLRRTAIVCVLRHPPTQDTIEVCSQLTQDPDPVVAKNAQLRLAEWLAAGPLK
jgi:hypothetical protein